MHTEAYEYVRRVAGTLYKEGDKVLEIGSLDINNTVQGMSIRELCATAEKYYGIDCREGPGVDKVVSAADYNGKEAYDLVISTETLEHAERPEDIIECAWRALRPGGAFVLTAAAPERAPHSYTGNPLAGDEPYHGIDPKELKGWLAEWQDVKISHHPKTGDVYAHATKPEAIPANKEK